MSRRNDKEEIFKVIFEAIVREVTPLNALENKDFEEVKDINFLKAYSKEIDSAFEVKDIDFLKAYSKEIDSDFIICFIFGLLLVRFGIFKTAIILLFTISPLYMYKLKKF